MHPPPPVHELDDELLAALYDSGALARGRAYAADGRVQALTVGPGSLRAVCRGSGRNTYLVRVRWHDSGRGIYLDDDCSCPLGGQCKHCVATVLEARLQAGPPDELGAVAPRRDWRNALVGLSGASADLAPVRASPLALQFAHKRPPTRYGSTIGDRIAVQPMRQGKAGRWIKTGASWQELISPYTRPGTELDPRQLSAARALASSGKLTAYGSSGPVTLDQFGADLWDHLERAQSVGIALIGEGVGQMVELATERAQVAVAVTAEPSGTIRVEATAVVGDEPVTSVDRPHGLIGAPVHGLWVSDPDHLRLVAFERPLRPVMNE